MDSTLFVVSCSLILAIVTLVTVYAFTARMIGTMAAKRQMRLLVPFVLGLLVLIGIAYLLVDLVGIQSPWAVLNAITLLIVGTAFVAHWHSRQRAGNLLLTLGRTRHDAWFQGSGLFIIGVGLLRGMLALMHSETNIEDWLSVLLQLTLGLHFMLISRIGMEVREGGVWYSYLIPWSRITEYWWERDRPDILTLQVTSWFPGRRYPSFLIPPDHRQTVQALLEQHTSKEQGVVPIK